jgi:hypothetical protein
MLKAERRKPSGEQHCEIEVIPSLTGVLAHFRFYEFNPPSGLHSRKTAVGRTELGGAKRPIEIDAQDAADSFWE